VGGVGGVIFFRFAFKTYMAYNNLPSTTVQACDQFVYCVHCLFMCGAPAPTIMVFCWLSLELFIDCTDCVGFTLQCVALLDHRAVL
jgi:hypothetical protein